MTQRTSYIAHESRNLCGHIKPTFFVNGRLAKHKKLSMVNKIHMQTKNVIKENTEKNDNNRNNSLYIGSLSCKYNTALNEKSDQCKVA